MTEKTIIATANHSPSALRRRPEWMKVPAPTGENHAELVRLVRELGLHTVCEEARCPNIGECWNHRTATFLLLGDICTRGCRFCAISKGTPAPLDEEEPQRIAQAVAYLKLRHAVLTSVNRDDLPDGGAHIFAGSIERIREQTPGCKVEVLIPDFDGNWDALQMVLDACPDVLNHNVETVPSIFSRFRPKASFERSVELLARARHAQPDLVTKSGIMVGAGETNDEVLEVMDILRGADVNVMTIGQYLAPTRSHWPIHRYVTPEEFAMFEREGLQRGFAYVESDPLVRSSYHAHKHVSNTW
jgi:lipoyl synthase